MRRLGYIGLALVTLVLALIVAVVVMLESRWFSEHLSGRLEAQWGRQVSLSPLQIDWSMHPDIQVENLRIANAPWAEAEDIARAESIRARVDLAALLGGDLVVEELVVTAPRVHLSRHLQKGANWTALLGAETDDEPFLVPRFREIDIRDGRLTYADPERDTQLSLQLETGGGQQLRVAGQGTLLGRSAELQVTGDPVRQAVAKVMDEGNMPFDLKGSLNWGEHRASVKGQTRALTQLGEMQFDLAMAGPDAAPLAQLFDHSLASLSYQLDANVSHGDSGWQFEDLAVELGDAELAGSMGWDTERPVPRVTADLRIDSVDLKHIFPDALSGAQEEAPGGAGKSTQEATPAPRLSQQIKQQLAELRGLEANLDIQVGELDLGEATLRDLDLQATLQNDLLKVEQLRAGVGGGTLQGTGEVDLGGTLPRGRLTLEADSVDLGAALPRFSDDDLGHVEGTLALRMVDDALIAGDSQLRYWREAENTDIDFTLGSDRDGESLPGITVKAEGQLKGRALRLDASGGPLLDLDDPGKPYPVSLDSTFGETHISAEGTLVQPLLLKDLELDLHVAGPDPARLWYILPFALPHLPPYDIRGTLVRDDGEWRVHDMGGTVGDSDIAGSLRWQAPPGGRTRLWADLSSDRLDLDDLLPAIGGAPAIGEGEEASPEQERLAEQLEEEGDVLPEGTLMQERLQAMDATVEFEAHQMRAMEIPFDRVLLTLTLDRGILRLEPLRLHIGEGKVDVRLKLDGTALPAEGSAHIDVSRVDLKKLLSSFDIADDSLGAIGGSGDVNFTGVSVAEALAHLGGDIKLLMSDGQLDSLLVEAGGVDLGEALFSIGDETPDPVDIQCAYAHLRAENGIATTESLIMATSDSNFVGGGKVNFAEETYELVFEAHPKDFSILTASSPIRVHGAFGELKVDPVSGELVGRGVLALIGAIAFPPAALLPLVELGETSGQGGCSKMTEDIKRHQAGEAEN